jgi:non-ribosomal peptide synthetase component F
MINHVLACTEMLLSNLQFHQDKLFNMKASSISELQTYWEKYLSGELPLLEFSKSLPRSIKTYNCSSYTFVINNRLTGLLKQLANNGNVSISDLLLAAFKVLLYRYTNETDILVGLQLTKLDKTELGKVADNANIVVSRDVISESISFKNFLIQVSHTVSEISEYQDYPFALLLKQLQSKANSSHLPICQALFTYQLELEYQKLAQEKIEFDLSLKIIETSDSLLCDFNYNSNLLDTETIAQMSEHYENLLKSIVSNPEYPVSNLSLLSARENTS